METIDDVMVKRFSKSLVHLLKVIDPDRRYHIDQTLGEKWDGLELDDQRRLYLYLLYRKWRGEGFCGTPYEIITNCHPYPTNWNGRPLVNFRNFNGSITYQSRMNHVSITGVKP